MVFTRQKTQPTDGRTDGLTDGQTDRRGATLNAASYTERRVITNPVFGQHLGDDRTDYSGDCSDTVRHSHQYAGVARRNVQMIHIEPCTHEAYKTQACTV